MGRPKGSRNKAKETNGGGAASSPADEGGRGIGDNSGDLTDDQRQALFWEQHKPAYEKALVAKKAADKRLKDVCKLAKAELGKNAVADIKLAIEAETPEGEAAIKERMGSQVRVLRWLGLPIGQQGELFPSIDLTPAVDKARADGKRSGFKGEPCSPPHDPSVPQHQSWIDGWQDGQAALVAAKLRPMTVENGDSADVRPGFMQRAERERSTGVAEMGDAPGTYQDN